MNANKYGAIRTERDGYVFDSKAEAHHYGELCLRIAAGEIRELRVHPRWPLVVNGVKIADYVADFQYQDATGLVVEDVKSRATRTPVYRLKARLMLALYGMVVREVLT